jgi:hypothetical protein
VTGVQTCALPIYGLFWYGFFLTYRIGNNQNSYLEKDNIEMSFEKTFFLSQFYYPKIEEKNLDGFK